jgi:hypothetical protein
MSEYKINPLLQGLDKLARLTGIPGLNERAVFRRRRMRILPIVILLLGTIGLAIAFLFPGKYWIGYTGVIISFAIANFFPIYGPIKRSVNGSETVDERDVMLKRNAYFVAFAVVSATSLLGVWLLIGLTVLRDWSSGVLLHALLAFSFYLMLLISTVPTLYVSWSVSELGEGED